jgi:hypothetical protein
MREFAEIGPLTALVNDALGPGGQVVADLDGEA